MSGMARLTPMVRQRGMGRRRTSVKMTGYGTAHAVQVFGAKALTCDDGKARRNTDSQAEDGHKDRRHGTDSRQGVDADRTADDDDIRDVVALLKDIADQERHCKSQDEADRTAGSHTANHKRNSSF